MYLHQKRQGCRNRRAHSPFTQRENVPKSARQPPFSTSESRIQRAAHSSRPLPIPGPFRTLRRRAQWTTARSFSARAQIDPRPSTGTRPDSGSQGAWDYEGAAEYRDSVILESRTRNMGVTMSSAVSTPARPQFLPAPTGLPRMLTREPLRPCLRGSALGI